MSAPSPKDGPQNLLVIMSDEHQARAMGCAGHPFVQTPNLDALAASGTRFTKAYTPSPICVPARAAFASGLPVHQTRLWDNAMPYTGEQPGWGHALQDAGVPVESIGKLHYRNQEDPVGFDVEHLPMMVYEGVGMVWASIRNEEERISPGARMLGEHIGPGTSAYTDYDQAVVERCLAWLDERGSGNDRRPWCLYVGLVAPHFPLVVPQQYYDLYPLESLPDVKLHPSTGYQRHPWVEKQNAFLDSEARFQDAEERLRAMASYYGLCTWLDHNVGRILGQLESCGLAETTSVIYTSDHGDNLGARGLWGKSNLYEESVAVPLIACGPRFAPGDVCETPVSLLDVSATIAQHFGARLADGRPGQDLVRLAQTPAEPERIVLSQYHAAGAVSGAFMLRKGRWKLIYYVGFKPELFDLDKDPEELRNLANDPAYEQELAALIAELRAMLDPEATDAQAHSDQAAMVARYGGREAALKLGAPGASPPPKLAKSA